MVCNTDAQHLSTTLTDNRLQLGKNVTEGLGCGANPDAGRKVSMIDVVILTRERWVIGAVKGDTPTTGGYQSPCGFVHPPFCVRTMVRMKVM